MYMYIRFFKKNHAFIRHAFIRLQQTHTHTQIEAHIGTHMCMCGHTGALKRKMNTMMFMESKSNFK